MTEPIEPELEARIVASLDGRLSSAQQAELDRHILREPAARAVMERYRDVDRRAAAALDAAVGGMHLAVGARGESAARWLRGGLMAAAAALLGVGLWVALQPGWTDPSRRVTVSDPTTRPPSRGLKIAAPKAATVWVHDTAEAAPMIDVPRRGDRVIDRQYFGAFDEDKREFYLWQVDRVRTRVERVENVSQDL